VVIHVVVVVAALVDVLDRVGLVEVGLVVVADVVEIAAGVILALVA
jgi:hypothetical protein